MHNETLADWIGADAERRFLKIPSHEVPPLMEWVMYVTGCPDADLIDEIENVLTGMRQDTADHAEFRNSVLYHEARKRHHRIGHGEECIADTVYSKAVKRINNSAAPESPCECGGVPLPGDWESLRSLFISADWAVTIKTLSDGAWMDLRRDKPTQALHMALFRPFRPTDKPASFVYDPGRKQWFAITEDRLITLAWQPTPRMLAAVAGVSNGAVAPPPPYLHRLPDGKLKVPGPGAGSRVNLPRPAAGESAVLSALPVPMTALTPSEKVSAKSLANASPQAFLEAVLVWLAKVNPDPRVFLCEDLISRTCSALDYLPTWYGALPSHRRPTSSVRKRRTVILTAVLEELGIPQAAPWQAATVHAEAVETVPAPPKPKPAPPKARAAKKPSGGMRIETCRVLAGMFPQEFEDLQEGRSEKQALLKLKELHYKLFGEIRRGLMEGRPVGEILYALPPELKAG